MKTDKELLELAAKACGLLKEYCGGEFTNFGVFLMPTPERPDFSKAGAKAIDAKPVELVKWNPLTDDGDALRLSAKMEISINHFDSFVKAQAHFECCAGRIVTAMIERGRLDAMRRAIVLAAAAIGESR